MSKKITGTLESMYSEAKRIMIQLRITFWHEVVKCSKFKQMQMLYLKWYDDVGITLKWDYIKTWAVMQNEWALLKTEFGMSLAGITHCQPGAPSGAFVQRT